MSRYFCFLWFVAMLGCSDANSLKPAEFLSQIRNTPDAVVVDVRTPEETHKTGVISGAQVIDFKAAGFETEIDKLDKSKTYFVYCASGKRSSKAADQMKEKGFEKVFVLDGGAKAWEEEGLELTSK